jgi:chorismate mutase/prephenate dehydratase
VVPIENSTEGGVARSLDLFLHTPLFIVGETSLFVRHNLLRKRDSLAGIQAVLRAPAGAGAVPRLAVTTCPAERRPVSSNAEGARLAASTRAGRHRQRARRQRVRPARGGPGDPGRPQQPHALRHRRAPGRAPAPQGLGHDCTSLVVSVANKPGAVHDLLVPLKNHGVSMTRFESRPARSGQWEYYFYIDVEGHPDEPRCRRAAELRAACAFFKVLGTYPIDVH